MENEGVSISSLPLSGLRGEGGVLMREQKHKWLSLLFNVFL